MSHKKVVVIGAGASGLMAAGVSAQNGAQVTLVEKNDLVGRKIRITGKGKCNVTNDCDVPDFIKNVPRNGRFLYSAVSKFTTQDAIDFFEGMNVRLETQRGRRVFPQSGKAEDIANALKNFVKREGCRMVKGEAESILTKSSTCTGVKLKSAQVLPADSVIICTGGMSYPATGSTGDGYIMARDLGHRTVATRPSLVPVVIVQKWCADLSGLALKNVAVKVRDNTLDKIIFEDFGELLFTHFGVSGPVVLSASAHMIDVSNKSYSVEIDLKPALTQEQLDARLQRDFEKNINRDFINSLGELLPKSLIPVIVELSGIPSRTKCNQITKRMRMSIVETLKCVKLDVKSFRPIDEAIVTAGGVDTSEINPRTMESKIINSLYFAGEVIDVDAYTGGYNLQIAFSTGFLAGFNAAY